MRNGNSALARRKRQRQSRTDSDPLGMEPGSIFVSYSSGDRPAVETLCDAFEEAKIDAWFDRQQLKAGDDWEKRSVRISSGARSSCR